MNQRQINVQIDRWVIEEDLPVKAGLKVIRRNDPDFGLTEDEIKDRNEFIRVYMMKDFGPIFMVPVERDEDEFVMQSCYGGAFNTHDFQRLHKPISFNGYHYHLKKVFEKAKDLAIMYSCISHEEGKENTMQRYRSMVDNEFKDEAAMLLETLQKYPQWVDRKGIARRLAKLNFNVRKCEEIWNDHAYSE